VFARGITGCSRNIADDRRVDGDDSGWIVGAVGI
jgi:hypothetical protein